MSLITKEEILKIAALSHIKIHEHEIEPLRQKLETVLTYASRVQEVNAQHEFSRKNINIFRDDVAIKSDADAILACAPEAEAHLFVVPSILENK